MSIPWIAAAVLTYFVLNTGLTAAMVAFVLDLPTVLVWRRGHRNVLLANLALPAAGVPVAGLWLAYPWMLICLGIAFLAGRLHDIGKCAINNEVLQKRGSLDEAIRRLQAGAGRQWDPRVVATFVQWAEAHERRPLLSLAAAQT
jgi:hypothetical protein